MDFLAAYGVAVCSNIVLYPLRDVVKFWTWSTAPELHWTFFYSRWKGMLLHPTLPLMISFPTASLYGTFRPVLDLTGSPFAAAVVASQAHALTKLWLSIYSRRIGSTEGIKGRRIYKGFRDCVVSTTKLHGGWSWFQGFSYMGAVHFLWYGMTMLQLSRASSPYQLGFSDDCFLAWQTHAFYGFVSAPFRNGFRSAAYVKDRHNIKSFADLLSYEKGVWTEGFKTIPTMVKERGPIYLVSGSLKVAFKTSLPWAVIFTGYRKMGGTLSPKCESFP
jgi:hypothetical protein